MAVEFIRMLTEAINAFNRVVQQAEEKLFDIEKTEYVDEYIANVKKMNILINFTENLIEETETMLEPNPAYRLEGKLMEKVNKISDRITPLESLGIAFDNASHEVKQYNYTLSKDFSLCGKYETKLGVVSKEFQNRATDIYVSKLKKILDLELRKFKEEEEILENLRLDYDSLRIRIKKSITVSGKETLEQEFEVADVAFHSKLEYNVSYFKSIDHYFEIHRELLKEFIATQSKYFLDCYNDLEKFKAKMESRVMSPINGKSSEVDPGEKKAMKIFHIPKSMKIITNEPKCIPNKTQTVKEKTFLGNPLVTETSEKETYVQNKNIVTKDIISTHINVSIENKELSEENSIEFEKDNNLETSQEESLWEKTKEISAFITERNEEQEEVNINGKYIFIKDENRIPKIEIIEESKINEALKRGKNENQINSQFSTTMSLKSDPKVENISLEIKLEEENLKGSEDLLPNENLVGELKIGEEKEENRETEETSIRMNVEDEEIFKKGNIKYETLTDLYLKNKVKDRPKKDEDNAINEVNFRKDNLLISEIPNEKSFIPVFKIGDSEDIGDKEDKADGEYKNGN